MTPSKGVAQLTQYIVLRKDLENELKWTLGSLMAQTCHASTAALAKYYKSSEVQDYLENLDNMHKVVLSIPTREDLMGLSKKLDQSDISHYLWIEHPEGIETCLATKPLPKIWLKPFFKGLELYK